MAGEAAPPITTIYRYDAQLRLDDNGAVILTPTTEQGIRKACLRWGLLPMESGTRGLYSHGDRRGFIEKGGSSMEAGVLGADVQQLRDLARVMESEGQQLTSLASSISTTLATTQWDGPDAQQFTSQWNDQLRVQVLSAVSALEAAATRLRDEATQQETTSASGGSGLGSGSGGGSSSGGSGGSPMTATPASTASGSGSDKPDKPKLDDLLRGNQVEDDPDGMVEWELSGFSRWLADLLGKDVPDARSVTATEARLLDGLGPLDLQAFSDIHDTAFAEASERYPSEDLNDDHNDAFRHTYWNALMAQQFGQNWAAEYATGHEGLAGNQGPREAMDLYNNAVGREIALLNPFASPEELADLVEEAVTNGDVVVIDPSGTGLAWSNTLTPDETGQVPDGAPGLPGQPVDELVETGS